MTGEEIETLLAEFKSWKEASLIKRTCFVQRMYNNQYGYDALTQAWGWYACGWTDHLFKTSGD